MSEQLTFLTLVGDFWTALGVKTVLRARDALDEAEQENYTFEKFALDMLGFYNDSIAIGISLIGAQGKPLPVPTLAIPLALGTDTGTGTLALGLAAGTVLNRSGLFNPPAKRVPRGNVTVSVTGSGGLKVDLAGLNLIPVIRGFYEGLVFSGGIPIAKIQLQIT